MEKLTLKEIAGYLPYKLSARLSQQGIFNLDSEHPNENAHKIGFIDNFYFNDGELSGSLKISEKFSFDFEEGDIEILLHPLEMLTKTIIHNGVEIIPVVELLGHSVLKKHNHLFGYDRRKYYSKFMIENTNEWVYNSIPSDFQSMDYFTVQKLQEWHIDYQNLIPRGLAVSKAIDKSTLNSK